jgi:hypothetical protein
MRVGRPSFIVPDSDRNLILFAGLLKWRLAAHAADHGWAVNNRGTRQNNLAVLVFSFSPTGSQAVPFLSPFFHVLFFHKFLFPVFCPGIGKARKPGPPPTMPGFQIVKGVVENCSKRKP